MILSRRITLSLSKGFNKKKAYNDWSVAKKNMQKKYKRKLGWDEEIVLFVVKVVGSTALLVIVAAGIDVYHLMH